MEQGRGVFLPEEQYQQQLESVQSRSLQRRWQQMLHRNPQQAIADWNRDDARKPAGAEALQTLESEVEQVRLRLRQELAMQLAAAVEQGVEPDVSTLTQAAESGVLNPVHLERRSISDAAASCDWRRRIDEQEDSLDAELLIDLACASSPMPERQKLLQRARIMAQVPRQHRQGMSRRLWRMYRDGYFGCPGDAETLNYLGNLQKEAEFRLQNSTEKENASWLDELGMSADNWVCFNAE
jgi:hypothetical protein